MKLFNLFLTILICSSTAFGQTSIYGKITDEETGEELIYANIVLHKNGVYVADSNTDFGGNYFILVDQGTYEMRISYTGYPDRIITDIIVKENQRAKLDIALTERIDFICVDNIPCMTIPMIQLEDTTSGQTITSEQIRNKATKKIQALTLNTPGVSFNNY